VSQYWKGKTNLDFTKTREVSDDDDFIGMAANWLD